MFKSTKGETASGTPDLLNFFLIKLQTITIALSIACQIISVSILVYSKILQNGGKPQVDKNFDSFIFFNDFTLNKSFSQKVKFAEYK